MKLIQILTLATSLLLSASSLILCASDRNRHNLFDPIFAFDDIDAHTVSANSRHEDSIANRRQPAATNSPTTSQTKRPISTSIASQRRPQSSSSSLVTRQSDFDDERPTFLRLIPNRSVASDTSAQQTTTKRQVVGTETPSPQPAQPRASRRQEEPTRHWSALENYYQKLRQPTQILKQQQQSAIPFYQVQDLDDTLNGYKPTQINNFSPTSANNGQTISFLSNSQSAANQKNPPFLLPLVNSQTLGANSEPDFNPSYPAIQQPAPGISRLGGIGANGLLLPATTPTASGRLQPAQQQQIPPYLTSTLNNQLLQQQQDQQLQIMQQQLPLANIENGRVKYLEWRKFPELLFIQQQQQRAKHQQETFGSWYDHQQAKELQQEEAFCGPRNYVIMHLTAAVSNGPGGGATTTTNSRLNTKNARLQNDQMQLYRILQSGSLGNQLDVPVTLSAGEYPSHMGIYNGTTPADDNFLCAATWVHEKFALTLASCVAPLEAGKLTVRAGEWNLNRNGSNSDKRSMILRQVAKVHLFPKYINGSMEHNLALVEFSKPVEFLDVPYVCPACQAHSRAAIKTSACWAPVRNVTFSEYFDAEGEGETKEKRNINMIELPVRLIANDENECYQNTKVEFFNFQHPNYICSADYRSANWRSKLNQTDYFGSGIYCNEGGNLSLVSILHPIHSNSSSAFGYMDLSYYRPWMRKIVSGKAY